MSWVRLDDQFSDHPKVLEAGPLAGWLWVCGLAYCNRLRTDGFIPAGAVPRLADVPHAAKLAATLVQAGLWNAVAGGFQVHDYLDYQPSREQSARTKEARAEAGRRGGSKPRPSKTEAICLPVATPVASEMSEANGKPKGTPYPYPYPYPLDTNDLESRDPIHPVPAGTACAPVDNFSPWFAAVWAAYPVRRGKKLHKAEAQVVARKISVADWDRVLIAVEHYAASDQGRKGIVEDAHRFLRHWGDWETPETELAAKGLTHHEFRPSARERESDQVARNMALLAS